MFDIGSSELLLIAVVAVLVIGPKDLPRALYKLGQVIGKGRAMARHFRSGIDTMIREAELDELKKQWEAENARIMAETSVAGDLGGEMLPLAGSQADAGAVTPQLPDAADSTDAPPSDEAVAGKGGAADSKAVPTHPPAADAPAKPDSSST